MFKTPSFIDALIWSSYIDTMRRGQSNITMEVRTYLDTQGELKGSPESTKAAFTNGIAFLMIVHISRRLRMCRNHKSPIMNADLDVILRQPGELKAGSHQVLLGVFVQIHSIYKYKLLNRFLRG